MAVTRSSKSGLVGFSRSQRSSAGFFKFSATGGTVTTSGGYVYHTFSSVAAVDFIPTTDGTIEVLAWGGGGAAGGTGISGRFCYGGGGGYAYSQIAVTGGKTYQASPGQGGQLGTQDCVTGTGGSGGTNALGYGNGGAGTAAGTSPCSGTGGGGGAASFFVDGSTVLVAAGGGGGGGGTESTENSTGMGGAGGQNGASGQGSNAPGGTTGGNTGSKNGTTASVKSGDHSGSGGGGGGYVGGTAGTNPDNDAVSGGGGGGGSSYGQTVTAGNYQTPAENSNALRGTAATGGGIGTAGSNGIIVIRYLA